MNIKALYSEQLLSAALTKFSKVSAIDLAILSAGFQNKYPQFFITYGKVDELKDYVDYKDSTISLKPNLSMDSTLKEKLSKIAGENIKEYMENLTILEFVLRKLDYLNEVSMEELKNNSSDIQLDELEKAYCFGLVEVNSKIKLSKEGQKFLFKKDNAAKLEDFKAIMEARRYSSDLIEEYLNIVNLKHPVNVILSIDNFISNVDLFKQNVIEPGAMPLFFKELEENELNSVLSINEKEAIYIVHPNDIFAGPKVITDQNQEMANINWIYLDIAKIFKSRKFFYTANSEDSSLAKEYIKETLRHQNLIKQKIDNKENPQSYLVIVECFDKDHLEDGIRVRCILRYNNPGYTIAYNPDYQEEFKESQDYTRKQKLPL